MSEGKKLFSEKEASEVLQRAARLQEERGEGSYAPGMTREDLLRIATEAGIDPQNLEAAIRAVSVAPPKRSFFNLVEENERVVDAELDPADFDAILEVAKPARTRRHPGAQVGRTLTMYTRYKGSMYHVEVASRNGRTRVRVASAPFMAYLMSLHPAILLTIFGSGYLGGHGVKLGAALFAVVTLMVGMIAFLGLVRRGNAKTAELTELLETKIRETIDRTRDNLRNAPPMPVEPADTNVISSL